MIQTILMMTAKLRMSYSVVILIILLIKNILINVYMWSMKAIAVSFNQEIDYDIACFVVN